MPIKFKEHVNCVLSEKKKRQSNFLGHVTTRQKLENLVMAGEFKGKRRREPKEKYPRNLTKNMEKIMVKKGEEARL